MPLLSTNPCRDFVFPSVTSSPSPNLVLIEAERGAHNVVICTVPAFVALSKVMVVRFVVVVSEVPSGKLRCRCGMMRLAASLKLPQWKISILWLLVSLVRPPLVAC